MVLLSQCQSSSLRKHTHCAFCLSFNTNGIKLLIIRRVFFKKMWWDMWGIYTFLYNEIVGPCKNCASLRSLCVLMTRGCWGCRPEWWGTPLLCLYVFGLQSTVNKLTRLTHKQISDTNTHTDFEVDPIDLDWQLSSLFLLFTDGCYEGCIYWLIFIWQMHETKKHMSPLNVNG